MKKPEWQSLITINYLNKMKRPRAFFFALLITFPNSKEENLLKICYNEIAVIRLANLFWRQGPLVRFHKQSNLHV